MSNIYGATSLIGGGSGALDGIDGLNLADGDACQVITDAGVYWYHLNSTSSASENSPFRINPDTNAGTKSWHLVGTTARIGAFVKLTGDEVIATSTTTPIPWDAEIYDTGNFWIIGSSNRLTIPIGVTDVIVKASCRWEINSTGARFLLIYKNGASFEGHPMNSLETPLATLNTDMAIFSPKVSVSATDYFDVRAFQSSGGDLDVIAGDVSWFSIEVVGFE